MKLREIYSMVKTYLHNTLWIMGDKLINIAVTFFVTVIVARYLEPHDFGVLSYALSITALFSAASHMGLSGLVVREIVKDPKGRAELLGTTLILKFIGMIIGYILLIVYAVLFEGIESVEFLVIVVAGAVLFFRPFDVIDFWFQAFLQSKYITVANLSALFISSILKLAFVFGGFGIIYFIAANLIQAAIISIVLIVIYKYRSDIGFSEWSFNQVRAKSLLSDGWVIYLGSIFAVVYLKIDQVMLRWFEGGEAVGIYAVAAQLSEAWYFVPAAIVTSFFPKLIDLKKKDELQYNKRLQQLFDLLFVLAFVVAIAMTLLCDWLILSLFGNDYAESSDILIIHIWAAIFIFMRAAFSKWILIENLLVFSLITQGAGALINIVLNYLLIPMYGGEGAAYATLVSYAIASFLSLLLYSKTRVVFFMMIKSMLIIFRYALFRSRT